ncbi:hypothetical protein GN956_G6813 [Arapaima gigas]
MVNGHQDAGKPHALPGHLRPLSFLEGVPHRLMEPAGTRLWPRLLYATRFPAGQHHGDSCKRNVGELEGLELNLSHVDVEPVTLLGPVVHEALSCSPPATSTLQDLSPENTAACLVWH